MRTATLVGSLLAATLAVTATPTSTPYNDLQWIQSEIDFIAQLQARLMGSPEHNILIDHIESELKQIGLPVYEDTIEFSYSDPPVIQPVLELDGQNIQLSGWIPYSGTNSSSATGKLVNVVTPNITATPNWAAAKDAIALANLTNVAVDFNTVFGAWPLSAPWPPQPGIPFSSANSTDLVAAAAAGVRGVVYIWENITAGLADNQYVPFQQANLAIPGVYVESDSVISHLLDAADSGTDAFIDLPGKRVPNTRSRTLYTIVNGTDLTLRNETAIINTHTDGVNAVVQNGHIALLDYARGLKANPPRRTTILVFVAGHLHYGELVTAPPGRATDLWLRAHPELWNGTQHAVFGSCVEDMGAVHFVEDLAKGTYTPTGGVEPELLFAATAPLAALTRRLWSGAEPNITRIVNPNTPGKLAQPGEGQPLLKAGIPEVSLVTTPAYLTKIYDRGFDERTLVNTMALVRQVASFERLWSAVDEMSAEDLVQ